MIKKYLEQLLNIDNPKEMMVIFVYSSIIFLLFISIIVNLYRERYVRIDVEIAMFVIFSISYYLFTKSKNPLRVEISITSIIFISEIILAIIVFKEHFLNYSTVFPMLISFSIFYFYSLKYALIMTILHYIFWISVLIYGYYEYPNHIILHDTTAMLGLLVSYIFMTFMGLSYYISTSSHEEKLRKANMQQSLLLKEIHHRVKNNLNIVSSMLGIQQLQEKDTHIIDLIKSNRLRIDSIATVHELLYRHEDFTQVNIGEYLYTLLDNARKMYNKEIQIHVNTTTLYLNLEKVLKFGIITNELVMNSIKHAFNHQNGEVWIDFSHQESELIFTYKDSGICNEENKNKIWEHANLGLKLIQMMVQQMNGTITVLENTQGLVYEIRITL